MAKGISYKDAGVDIEAGNRAVELLKHSVKKTWRPEVLTDLGGFGGLFALNVEKYRQPVLVSGTDGVGTKLRVAFAMGKHDTVGIDAVAMCVNDILVQGAEPLFFLDYLAVGKLEPEKVAEIVGGIARGCEQAGCTLIGGETAEMPGFYEAEEYDIAGFAVGVVDRENIVDGSTVRKGDVIIGIPSSGLHSNGYSLARKVLLHDDYGRLEQYVDELGCTLGEEMLKPTIIYVPVVLPLLDRINVKGMAHITGGGLVENVPRVLPQGLTVKFDFGSWPVPPIFKLIQQQGDVAEEEMYRTFNMGIGFVLIVAPEDVDRVRAEISSETYVIGTVI
ncbi:MAG: phosphoribosylformylglycinamidine cyclo-ligase [Thermoanaerobacteraceae bacterium]|nr:phosphoribosylformylglycinamidine cyclo-ligase [Thermoanaerobacteraceae bacterium]